MNYLMHAYFSGKDNKILVGNMIGDFVKGLPKHLVENEHPYYDGIMLHRKIDEYSDQHMAIARAKNIFRSDYRLYSGAIVDVVFDHFFANDPHFFQREDDHKQFSQHVFSVLNEHEYGLPDQFRKMYQYMRDDNWLFQVRNLKGLEKSIKRMMNRIPEKIDDGTIAYQLTMRHYYELNQMYYEFVDDFEKFINTKLIDNDLY